MTKKANLNVRDILSTIKSYNYNLVKWLEENTETTLCNWVLNSFL